MAPVDAAMEKLRGPVTRVELRSNGLSSDDIVAIAEEIEHNRTAVTQLKLIGTGFGTGPGAAAMARALRANTSVFVLCLESNKLGVRGASALADVLRANSTIDSLSVISNNLGVGGMRAIAEALKVNTTLQRLSFSRCSISDTGAEAFAEGLKENTSLLEIHLNDNDTIRRRGVAALSAALRHNSTLELLMFDAFDVAAAAEVVEEEEEEEEEGEDAVGAADARKASPFFDALRCPNCSHLLRLNFTDQDLGDVFMVQLAEALATNVSVLDLDCSLNDIGDEGAIAVASALRVNTTLSVIELSANQINVRGIASLAAALHHNTAVRALKLANNRGGPGAVAAIAEMLAVNRTLESLAFWGDICENSAQRLAAALRVNRGLVDIAAALFGLTRELFGTIIAGLVPNSTLLHFVLGLDEPIDLSPILALLEENHTLLMFGISYNPAFQGELPQVPAAIAAALAPGQSSAASWALVPLTEQQRLAFLRGHSDPNSPIRRLPLDIIRRILTCYEVSQGVRVLSKNFIVNTMQFGQNPSSLSPPPCD
jgi:Ran GTPase-activating protein (RanGAP) involved in mRNA processing and transport